MKMEKAQMFVDVFLTVCLVPCVKSAQWTSSLPDGAVVDACAGDAKVIFPWEITLEAGESIYSARWFHRGRSDTLIATFTSSFFFPSPVFSHRVQRVSDVGLALNNVTEADQGNFTVQVVVDDGSKSQIAKMQRTAMMVVSSESEAKCRDKITPALERSTFYTEAETESRSSQLQALQAKYSQLQASMEQHDASVRILRSENSQLQTEISHLKARLDQHIHRVTSGRVAFLAEGVNDQKPSAGQRYIFPQAHYNQGRAYNSSTGVFTAPVSGVYVFLVTTRAWSTGKANVILYLDNTWVNGDYSTLHGDAIALPAVCHVRAGQTVSVKSNGAGSVGHYGTALTGFLLYPDA